MNQLRVTEIAQETNFTFEPPEFRPSCLRSEKKLHGHCATGFLISSAVDNSTGTPPEQTLQAVAPYSLRKANWNSFSPFLDHMTQPKGGDLPLQG
jgi:hypothetical protein